VIVVLNLILDEVDDLKIKKQNKINEFKSSLKETDKNDVDLNQLFIVACSHGHYKIAKFLLEDVKVDPSFQENRAFNQACKNGFLKIAKLCLSDQRVDPSCDGNFALHVACRYRHLDIIDLLLQDQRVLKPQDVFDISHYSEEVRKIFQNIKRTDHAQESNLKKIKI
jgi:ankyrin repeat protein